MFKNYFKTAFRNIWKNKITSSINLFGLSVGMTAAVFIFLWVQNEISFDNYHAAKNNIYRITNTIHVNKNETWIWENSPMPLAQAAAQQIPEVKNAARVVINAYGGMVFTINHKLFAEKTSAWVEKTWFNIFDYHFVAGNAAAFGQNPFSIILTESKAKKYFGDESPIGKIIKVDTVNYTVQGVIKDNPLNSSFRFDVLLQMDGRFSNPQSFKNDNTWHNYNFTTFLKLAPNAKKPLVESKLNNIVAKNRSDDNNLPKVSLEPLKDMYFESDLQSSTMPHGNKKTTYIFFVLGLMLLITASINYVNLTTARASLRAKEVSVRKIAGAQRGHLFLQFIIESVTISMLSLIITLLLIQLCLPAFNSIADEHFQLPVNSPSVWKILLGTLAMATILNGVYPAALLSSFKPLNVFRGKSLLRLSDGSIRKGLVVFQFGLSVILIMGTIVIYRQLNYIQTSNPGYNISQTISLQIPWKSYSKMDDDQRKNFFTGMKQDLQSESSISAVSIGGSEIMNVGNASSGNADWDGRDTTFNPTIADLSADEDFQNMFQLQLKSGHWFKAKEDMHNFILNETAAKEFNMHTPILGQRFTYGGDTGKIIGIVKDFNYKSMHEKIGPMVLSFNEGSDSYIFIKTMPGNIPRALNAAEKVWSKFIPAQPFDFTFLDDSFNNLYKSDIKTSQLILIFSIIAIIISALGLFGLAAFTAERRTKEIGIRKVLGASVQQIVMLLSKDFVRLVIVAIVIACPIAWLLMNNWLQDFAYRINITAWIFIMAGSLALLIALMSISFQAIKAAIANPVKSLRTE